MLGAGIFVLSYMLVSLDVIHSRTRIYYLLNLMGIGMAFSSHIVSLNPASATIQFFVICVSVLGLVRNRPPKCIGDPPRHRSALGTGKAR